MDTFTLCQFFSIHFFTCVTGTYQGENIEQSFFLDFRVIGKKLHINVDYVGRGWFFRWRFLTLLVVFPALLDTSVQAQTGIDQEPKASVGQAEEGQINDQFGHGVGHLFLFIARLFLSLFSSLHNIVGLWWVRVSHCLSSFPTPLADPAHDCKTQGVQDEGQCTVDHKLRQIKQEQDKGVECAFHF